MKLRFSSLGVLALCAAPLLRAADPLTGDWTAEATRSARHGGLHTQSLRIRIDGSKISVAESGVRPSGEPYTLKFTADCDGKPYGVAANPDVESVQCWHDDPRKLVLKLLKGAEAIEWRTAEATKNGQSLRITTTVTDAKGREEKTAAQFVKK